jgi:hypothetical protein
LISETKSRRRLIGLSCDAQSLRSSGTSYSAHQMMDLTATSPKQPSVAVLPVDSLEQTLPELHVDIDVQSFIEKVISHPALPTLAGTHILQDDKHPAMGSQHLLSASTYPTLQFDSLSMAMEELGLPHSAVTLMKTAQLVEFASMPDPTPEGRQFLLERKPDPPYSLSK